MSQIRRSSLALATVLPLLVMALSGCGDINSQATLEPGTGKHVAANWLPSGHKETAKANIAACSDCHGQDLKGGISNVSCTQCHIGNAQSVHPGWGAFAYAFHAGYVESSATGSTSCAVASCHGANLLGVASSGPSCAINCHMDGTAQTPRKHAWDSTSLGTNVVGHIAYFNANPINYTTCRNNACHGGAGATTPPPGVFLSGPACLGCHGSGNPLPAESN